MKGTVLITGATSGIGFSFAKIFARERHSLVLVARNESQLNRIRDRLEWDYNIGVKTISKDLTEKNAADEIFKALSSENITIDILVNNAGYGDFGPFAEADWEKQYNMVQLNIQAMMHMTKRFLTPMLKRGSGWILNIASIAAFQPGPYWAVYAASKAYVLSFTEAVAEECRGTGVRLLALCPGPTKTGFEAAAHMEVSTLFEKFKVATPDEVAEFGYRSLRKGSVVAVHGARNKIFMLGSKFGPRSIVRKIAGNLHGNRRNEQIS